MPRKGPDKRIVEKIRHVLKANPQGLWIREIARRAELPKSTVHKYVNTFMKNDIQDVVRGRGNFIRIIKLIV